MPLRKERRLRLPGVEMSIALDNRLERFFGVPYRSAAQLLGGRKVAASKSTDNVASTNGHVDVAPLSVEAKEIADRVKQIEWYHVIELPHGIVTPGRADHRTQKHLYGLPEDMSGMRVLDVATFDGFWAFEMERRGADVTAVDIGRWSQADIPLRWKERLTAEEDTVTGAGFRLAKELLGSRVERREMSVYDLNPKELGQFDLVMLSDLLLHIRDPQHALEKLWAVVKNPGGHAIIAEPYSPELEDVKGMALTQWIGYDKFVWQIPSTATLRSQLHQAGFEPV
ncbi:MAG: methyltransferase domain-containing protein, partial [Dehalococcoidia bacterium]